MTASWRAASDTTVSSNSTRARLVPRLTLAFSTPGVFSSVRSLRIAQAAQCIPPIAKVAMVIVVPPLAGCFGDDRELRSGRHHPHAAVEAEIAGLLRREGDDRHAVG